MGHFGPVIEMMATTEVMTNFNFSWPGLLMDLAKAVLTTVVGSAVKWALDRKLSGSKAEQEAAAKKHGAEDFQNEH
jgi:membrane protein YqaA with SNARE-associated domain